MLLFALGCLWSFVLVMSSGIQAPMPSQQARYSTSSLHLLSRAPILTLCFAATRVAGLTLHLPAAHPLLTMFLSIWCKFDLVRARSEGGGWESAPPGRCPI